MKCLLDVSRKRLMKDMRFTLGLRKDRVLEEEKCRADCNGKW